MKPGGRLRQAHLKLSDWFQGKCFELVHRHNLVYNTCWEDPRLDRQALNLGPQDVVLMITSAGCNALDYALQGPRTIHCVDMNPRQNALLELKLAGIRRLDYQDFFALFGQGRHPDSPRWYRQALRPALSPWARAYWDRKIQTFLGEGPRRSFYFHGTSGVLAWMVNWYIDWVAKVRDAIAALLAAPTLEDQRRIYTGELHGAFWGRFLRWAMDRDATLSFLGVPRAQRQQVESTYPGGIARFIEDRIETVFSRLPLHDNYFWRVYLTGSYTPDCCPEYLQPDNFLRLREGMADCIRFHTDSLMNFAQRHQGGITRFVLLDHMDWLSTGKYPLLKRQWQVFLDRAAPNARFLWRSGGLKVDFVDPIEVEHHGRRRRLGELLTYQSDLADRLHRRDRVHTYGSFYIADLQAA